MACTCQAWYQLSRDKELQIYLAGTEDLSPGDEISCSPGSMEAAIGGMSRSGPRPKLKRPRIVNKPRPARPIRPASPSQLGDWGERCVDVYERINHIGEGTYGQVHQNNATNFFGRWVPFLFLGQNSCWATEKDLDQFVFLLSSFYMHLFKALLSCTKPQRLSIYISLLFSRCIKRETLGRVTWWLWRKFGWRMRRKASPSQLCEKLKSSANLTIRTSSTFSKSLPTNRTPSTSARCVLNDN